MPTQDDVSQIIRTRRTWKVLGDIQNPVELTEQERDAGNQVVRQAVADGAFAPFHYDRKLDGQVEPFRFHILWEETCRSISRKFFDWFPDAKTSNKLPSMLSACGSLVLVTWLPEKPWNETAEKLEQVNEEHLAAASAAVQNVLLSLTAAGFGSYWSSGGQFRLSGLKARLGISEAEKLIAAVFVEYPSAAENVVKRIPGKHHPNRSEPRQIIREVHGLA